MDGWMEMILITILLLHYKHLEYTHCSPQGCDIWGRPDLDQQGMGVDLPQGHGTSTCPLPEYTAVRQK